MLFNTSIPVAVKTRPLVLITGFLGAGKTTFLKNFLANLSTHSLCADVILNDYENADLDAQTIQEKTATIFPLSASCACCGGFDDLIRLSINAQNSKSDLLLIELNGTADPIPVLETFTLLEGKLRFRPRLQVAIIDARLFETRGIYNELESIQLQTASHFILSHTENISESQREDLITKIHSINPHATLTSPTLLSEEIATIILSATSILQTDDGSIKNFPRPNTHSHAHALSHSFTGCTILLPDIVTKTQIKNWLESLPSNVIRVKTLVTTKDKPNRRQLFERVGTNTINQLQEVPIHPNVPPSAICIGPKINPEDLLQLAIKHISPQALLPLH